MGDRAVKCTITHHSPHDIYFSPATLGVIVHDCSYVTMHSGSLYLWKVTPIPHYDETMYYTFSNRRVKR